MKPSVDGCVLPLESPPTAPRDTRYCWGGGVNFAGTRVSFVDGSWVSSRGLG